MWDFSCKLVKVFLRLSITLEKTTTIALLLVLLVWDRNKHSIFSVGHDLNCATLNQLIKRITTRESFIHLSANKYIIPSKKFSNAKGIIHKIDTTQKLQYKWLLSQERDRGRTKVVILICLLDNRGTCKHNKGDRYMMDFFLMQENINALYVAFIVCRLITLR